MSDAEQDFNPYAPPQASMEGAYDPIQVFGSSEALNRVATGLNMVYWGIAIVLLSIIGGAVLVPLLAGAGGMAGAAGGAGLVGLGVITGVLLGFIGRIFCLPVPEESRARPFIFAAVAFDMMAMALNIVTWVLVIPSQIAGLSPLFSLLATVLFVVFMKRLANYIAQPVLAGRAQSLIVMGFVVFGLFLAMMGVGFLGQEAVALVVPLVLIMLFLVLFMFLRYVRLIVDLRSAILGNSQEGRIA